MSQVPKHHPLPNPGYLPAPIQPHSQSLVSRDMTNSLWIKLPLSHIAAAVGHVIWGTGFRLLISPTQLPTIEEQSMVEEEGEPGGKEAEISIGNNDRGDEDPFIMT